MGGIIIILAILIPTLLFAKLENIYVILMLITTVWLGFLGFTDDYLKIKHKNEEGLKGTYKIIGQIALGFIIGGVLYFSDDVVIRTKVVGTTDQQIVEVVDNPNCTEFVEYIDVKSTRTTIPFLKDNEFDYSKIVWFLDEHAAKVGWLIFIIATILIVTAVSNGANLTDGLDGLATGTS